MKNTNVVISLDTRRAKKDGTFPVVMRLGHNERTTAIPIGFSILEKDWDVLNKVVKKTYVGLSSVTRLNNLIQKKKSEAMDIILKLHEADQLNTLSVSQLRDRVAQESDDQSFFDFCNYQVRELIKANRIGTARSYKGVINILKTFSGKKDLSFYDITFAFLTKFETYHKSRGNEANGLAVYMRTIRAIYNKAIKEGLVEKEHYPFAIYKIKTTPTEKRALDIELLQKIINLTLEPNHTCFNARNYFLASYMMYGMNFTDMAFLKKSDLNNGRINYRRRKTSKVYDIKITSNLKTIIDYYIKNDTDFIFQIVKTRNLIFYKTRIFSGRENVTIKN